MPANESLGSGQKKKLVTINAAAVKGEPGTGYEAEDGLGEFECANCRYFTPPNGCNQKDMKANSKLPRLFTGRVKVDPEGCCEYVDRVGRKDKDQDKDQE